MLRARGTAVVHAVASGPLVVPVAPRWRRANAAVYCSHSSRLLTALFSVVCVSAVCRCYTQYPFTAKEPELRAHCDNKHPDFKFEQAFPDYGKE